MKDVPNQPLEPARVVLDGGHRLSKTFRLGREDFDAAHLPTMMVFTKGAASK